MGNSQSARDRRLSKAIEKDISRDKRQAEKNIKLLLLGAGESGKSTMLKQIKQIYTAGFTKEERLQMKEVILDSTLASMVQLLNALPDYSLTLSPQLETSSKLVQNATALDADGVCEAMELLWADSTIQACAERGTDFLWPEWSTYFLNEVKRISKRGYIPTFDDLVHLRVKTTGITELNIEYKDQRFKGKLKITLVDVGGQRSERKKWIHCFENVTAIVFFVDISSYDMKLVEDINQNRFAESISLFKAIVNSQWFVKTHFILFMNKVDLLEKKIKTSHISDYFPSFKGGDDLQQAIDWMYSEFVRQDLHEAKKKIYRHITCATDTNLIRRVFADVANIIITENLKIAGLL